MTATKSLARILIPRNLRNWLRSPSNSLQWAWAKAKYAAGVTDIVQIRPGWSLICHPAAYRFAYFAQEHDPDQVAEFDSFIQQLTPNAILFDIGAHFGLFSLATLHYGGTNAKAVAVDPSPLASGFIRKQAELNQVSNRLHTVRAAVSDHVGWQPMISVGIISGGYFVSPSKEHPPAELTSTPTTTLDQLAEEFNLFPTHVKIDVEGYELSVICGGIGILSRNDAPLLFIELHNEMVRQNGGVPEETLARVRSLGYEVFSTDGEALDDQAILDRPLIRVVGRKIRASAG
jgi:FkbM family methyltransferase